jgi:hypothetical protein
MFSSTQFRQIIILLLLALLLLGMGRVFMLPPFDGMDETAHYSRIEAAAFAPPDMMTSFISTDVVEYYKYGPMPRGWIIAQAFNSAYNESLETGKPIQLKEKLEKQGYRNYRQFFTEAKSEDNSVYQRMFRDVSGPDIYKPSADENWQYQHPPLYYVVMGKVLRFASDMPLVERLFVLRTFSFLMAFSGFCIGLYATLRHFQIRGNQQARDIVALGAFYPFVMPVWFAEYGRLGNDSLCLLFYSLIWALVLWHRRRPREVVIWVIAGVVMGYACLVKFFMFPMSLGFLAFMAVAPLPENAPKGLMRSFGLRVLPALVAGLSAVAIGIGPYIQKRGALGSLEIGAWIQGRGFLKPEQGIPYEKILWNLQNMLSSMISGFANMAVPQIEIIAMVVFFMLAAVLGAWLLNLPRDPRKEEWLPLYPLLPMLGGLFLHAVFAAIAYRAAGLTPGSYIHVEAPALALIFGAGLLYWTKRLGGRLLVTGLLATSVAINAAVTGVGLAMYSGCLWLDMNSHELNVDGHGGCRFSVVYSHLALLSWPAFGLPAVMLGLLLLALAVFKAVRCFNPIYGLRHRS